MISFKEAEQIIVSNAHSFGEEVIDLDEAYGRILCEAIKAYRDYPPVNRATMDGIAIKKEDWDNGIREFTISEIIYAGKESKRNIDKGECYKIMTGAAVPAVATRAANRDRQPGHLPR